MVTLLGRSKDSEQTVRPSLSTIHSADGRGSHHKPIAIEPSEEPPSPSRIKSRTSSSLGRKPLSRRNLLSRSETMTSKPQLTRVPSVQTRYMEMLLHLDEIPRVFNILASLFTWIILAGFLVVPGTFTTFKESEAFQKANNDGDGEGRDDVAHAIVHSIENIGLLWLSGAFCVVGTLGCIWLWYRWNKNYVWLINRVFLPVTMNSVAGLITTLVNVYTAQEGVWSVTAKITAIVTGSCVGVAGFLFLCYNFWALRRVRNIHERELGLDSQHENETLVEKVKRKAQEPPLQSGSVV